MSQNTTNRRVEREAAFHDAGVHRPKPRVAFYSDGAGRHAVERLYELLANLEGKRVLDFGCGSGWNSVDLALRGATVDGFDISQESLKVAQEYAEEKGVADRIRFRKDNAEDLSYGNNSFDIVTGTGILHHLDLNAAFREIRRVLKPGGKAYFIEPLGHNPFINLYRKLTPSLRTVDERPLRLPELQASVTQFSRMDQEFFYFLGLISFFLKLIINSPALFSKSLDILVIADGYLLKMLPFLRRYCWSTLIILEK